MSVQPGSSSQARQLQEGQLFPLTDPDESDIGKQENLERERYREWHQQRQKKIWDSYDEHSRDQGSGLLLNPPYYIFEGDEYMEKFFEDTIYVCIICSLLLKGTCINCIQKVPDEQKSGTWSCENCYRKTLSTFGQDREQCKLTAAQKESTYPPQMRNTEMFCPLCKAWRHTRENSSFTRVIIDGNVRGLGPITWLGQWVCLKCAELGRYTVHYLNYSCTREHVEVAYYPEFCSRPSYRRGPTGGLPMVPTKDITHYANMCRPCARESRFHVAHEKSRSYKFSCLMLAKSIHDTLPWVFEKRCVQYFQDRENSLSLIPGSSPESTASAYRYIVKGEDAPCVKDFFKPTKREEDTFKRVLSILQANSANSSE